MRSYTVAYEYGFRSSACLDLLVASNRLYIELGRLARESQAVMAGEFGEVLSELLQAGGSPGGARPKELAGVRGDDLVTGPEPYPDGYEP
jgi:hypothetical protein